MALSQISNTYFARKGFSLHNKYSINVNYFLRISISLARFNLLIIAKYQNIHYVFVYYAYVIHLVKMKVKKLSFLYSALVIFEESYDPDSFICKSNQPTISFLFSDVYRNLSIRRQLWNTQLVFQPNPCSF